MYQYLSSLFFGLMVLSLPLLFSHPAEDLSDSEVVFPKEITKWSSNDLMDKIEATDPDEAQGAQMGWGLLEGGLGLPFYQNV